MKADDAKRLKELERENARLKRIVADKELEIEALREIAGETGEPVAATPRRGHAAASGSASRSGGRADRRAAPLHPTPPAGRGGSGPGPARAAAALRQAPSPVGLPARPRRAAPGGLRA